MVQLHFGKYTGRPLPAVPTRYLRWLLSGCDRLDDWTRQAVKQELRRRGERYLNAAVVLADLEEIMTARVSEDRRLDHETAGIVSDHLLVAFEQLREKHNVGDVTELTIAPPRNGPGRWQRDDE